MLIFCFWGNCKTHIILLKTWQTTIVYVQCDRWALCYVIRNHPSSTYAKFSEKLKFLPPDTHTFVCGSGGKKCLFFGKCCVRTKWMILQILKDNHLLYNYNSSKGNRESALLRTSLSRAASRLSIILILK